MSTHGASKTSLPCEIKKNNRIIEKLSTKDIAVFSFCAGVVLSFFQINVIAMESFQWGGQFSPYNVLQIYLSDAFFALAVIAYGIYVFANSKRVFFSLGNSYAKLAISLTIFFGLVSYFFSINETVTFFWLIEMLKLLVVYVFVINRLISEKNLITLLLVSLGLQLVFGILQFAVQSSIGLNFLGESSLGPAVPNTAKIDVGDLKIVRPYGTFTHANVFGGLISIGFLLSAYLYMKEEISRKKTQILLGIFLIGVLLSFSRSAWLAMTVSTLLFLSFRKFKITYLKIRNFTFAFLGLIFVGYFTGVLNLILIRLQLTGDTSILERMAQIKTSFFMMLTHPFGVGLGNFVNAADKYSSAKLMPWQFEPVHNTFLLIGAELGIIAMLISISAVIVGLWHLFRLLTKTEGKYKCFPIYFAIILITHLAILLNLDHYFYTNYSAGVVVMVMLGIMTNELANLEERGVSLQV